jgi:hypothetical protein
MGHALARWWVTILGGILIGGGLVLHGQIAFAKSCRSEVGSVFFLWRGVGQVTFIFQDDRTKLALWLNEIPEQVLVESDRAAWTLVVLGSVLAVTSTFFRRCGKKRR